VLAGYFRVAEARPLTISLRSATPFGTIRCLSYEGVHSKTDVHAYIREMEQSE